MPAQRQVPRHHGARARGTRFRGLLLLAAAALPLACRARQTQPPPAPRPVGRADVLELFPALSPDGRHLAYSSARSGRLELYVRPVDGEGERQLTFDAKQNVQPAWSPDGRELAFHSKDRGGIWVVPASGGAPRLVADFGSRPAFSPDGRRIAFQSARLQDVAATASIAIAPSTIWVVPAQGGPARAVTSPGEPKGGHGAPAWSTDGSRLFFVSAEPRLTSAEIYSVAADGSGLKLVASGTRLYDPVVLPGGRNLLFSGTVDGATYALGTVAADGSGPPVFLGPAGPDVPRHPSVSADGRRLAWSVLTTSGSLWKVPLEPASGLPTGPARELTPGAGRSTWPAYAPDGRSIAFGRYLPGSSSDVWIMAEDGSAARQLVDTPATEYVADFFPDGRLLLFSDRVKRKFAFSTLDPATRQEQPLGLEAPDAGAPRLAPDGRRIAFHTKRSGITLNVWVADVATGTQHQLTFDREFAGFPCWSPDSSLLAFQVRRGDDVVLATVAADGGTPALLTETRGLSWPFSFSPDGDRIAIAAYRNDSWNVAWVSRSSRKERLLTDNTRIDVYTRYPLFSPRGDALVFERAETRSVTFLQERPPLPAP